MITKGSRLVFLGYKDLPLGAVPIIPYGQLVVALEIGADGALTVLPIDEFSRVFATGGDTVFEDEVVALPFPPIPEQLLPPPYGMGEPNPLFSEPRITIA